MIFLELESAFLGDFKKNFLNSSILIQSTLANPKLNISMKYSDCQNLRIGDNPKLVLIRKNFVLPNKKKSISIKIYLIITNYQLVL
jgi:hypothetical protein